MRPACVSVLLCCTGRPDVPSAGPTCILHRWRWACKRHRKVRTLPVVGASTRGLAVGGCVEARRSAVGGCRCIQTCICDGPLRPPRRQRPQLSQYRRALAVPTPWAASAPDTALHLPHRLPAAAASSHGRSYRVSTRVDSTAAANAAYLGIKAYYKAAAARLTGRRMQQRSAQSWARWVADAVTGGSGRFKGRWRTRWRGWPF